MEKRKERSARMAWSGGIMDWKWIGEKLAAYSFAGAEHGGRH